MGQPTTAGVEGVVPTLRRAQHRTHDPIHSGDVKGSTSQRGYGGAHQRERARWAPHVAAGLVACARCGERIPPGAPWDLGHHDHDRTRYSGPEHRACNRSAAGKRGWRAAHGRAAEAPAPTDPAPRPMTRW